jgi:hypothetical protein
MVFAGENPSGANFHFKPRLALTVLK